MWLIKIQPYIMGRKIALKCNIFKSSLMKKKKHLTFVHRYNNIKLQEYEIIS